MSFLNKKHLFIFLVNIIIAIILLFVIGYIVLDKLDEYTQHGFSIEVPNLQGMDLTEAEVKAAENQLQITVVDSVYASNTEPGIIMEQFPRPHAKVKNNRIIQLTINAHSPEKIQFPNLRNTAFRQALQQINVLGLKIGRLEFAPSNFRYLVLDFKYDNQTLEPGTEIEKGKQIDMVLGAGSSGNDQVYLPNLIGKTVDEAKYQAIQSYLNVGQIIPDSTIRNTTDMQEAIVYKQEPEYDEKQTVQQGFPIILYISLDKKKITEQESILTQLQE